MARTFPAHTLLWNHAAGLTLTASPPDHAAIDAWLEEGLAIDQQLESYYKRGLSIGVPKEIARIRRPVNHYSRMRAAGNLRNWLAFLSLRLDLAAMKEIRLLAEAVGQIVSQQFPRTWALFNVKQSSPAHATRFCALGLRDGYRG